MRFEEVLPALREGRKIKRALWPKECFLQMSEQGLIDEHGVEDVLSNSLLSADDWELVPEKRKFKYWLKIYDDGSVFGFDSLEKAEENMSLAEHHGKTKLVETRMIEWESYEA